MEIIKKFPFSRLEIEGSSMAPNFAEGERVFVSSFSEVIEGDVAVFQQDSLKIMKRVHEVNGDKFFVLGDNPNESTDSRTLGWLGKKQLLGKVLFKY